MSETPGRDRPGDDAAGPGDEQPPYPGWSPRQRSASGWTAPGQSAPPPGPPPQPGWGTGTSWGWQQPPAVKPGVIPLRPLGVGEILDGAVTTIRRNPGPMLGLSAIVAVVTQLLGLVLGWVLFRETEDVELSRTAGPDEIIDAFAGAVGPRAVVVVVTWLATVVLTGILTVVVSRAVLGEDLAVGDAWRYARARLPKLLLLTLLYSLIWLAPFIGGIALAAVIGAATGDGDIGAGIGLLLFLAAIPPAIWLYVRYALCGPSLMLETRIAAGGSARPVGVVDALRRSAELVRTSWWRAFGILLLVVLIAFLIAQVVSVPFSYVPFFIVGDDPTGGAFFGTLVLSALGGIVASTFTAPFTAAATALLYVDRRIRREGLDIVLARAAGVTIPGHTDAGPAALGAP